MKKHATTVFVLMLAALTALVNAQVVRQTITANVPFEFIANGKTMPAGKCTITTQGDGVKVLWIRSGNENLLAVPHDTESLKASEKTVLVFHRYGNHYFLASISREGQTRGYEFPLQKMEAELRAQNAAEKDVSLLAGRY
jgi:hypothetical protein